MKLPHDYSIPDFKENDVHLWSFKIPLTGEKSDLLFSFLSKEEKEKSERLIIPDDRIKSQSVYGLLRYILSKYLNCFPEEIIFSYTDKGKPFINGSPKLSFNLSHSGNRVLFGVTRGFPVGVDLELIKNYINLDDLIKRYCSLQETKQIMDKEGKERLERFYNIWTLKEALLKGKGIGISVELKDMDLFTSRLCKNWSMVSCTYWTGYAAAVAVPVKYPEIHLIT